MGVSSSLQNMVVCDCATYPLSSNYVRLGISRPLPTCTLMVCSSFSASLYFCSSCGLFLLAVPCNSAHKSPHPQRQMFFINWPLSLQSHSIGVCSYWIACRVLRGCLFFYICTCPLVLNLECPTLASLCKTKL